MTVQNTLQSELNKGDANTVADVARKMKLGDMLAPKLVTITQASAAAVTLDPPALIVQSARVTAGTALAGVYRVTDSGGTPVDSATLGVATLSDDGATLTFGAALTGVVVRYIPRSAVDMTSGFPASGLDA